MRLAARRDANERVLFEAAEKMGALIVPTGPLDGWVCHRGRWVPVEVKALRGRYTAFQTGFLLKCQQSEAPVWTWRTLDDVLESLSHTAPEVNR